MQEIHPFFLTRPVSVVAATRQRQTSLLIFASVLPLFSHRFFFGIVHDEPAAAALPRTMRRSEKSEDSIFNERYVNFPQKFDRKTVILRVDFRPDNLYNVFISIWHITQASEPFLRSLVCRNKQPI